MDYKIYNKYGFHTVDKGEVEAILADENGKIVAIKNEAQPYFHEPSYFFNRYVEGSTPNKNFLKKSYPPRYGEYIISTPPQFGEYLLTQHLKGLLGEVSALKLTEINTDFKFDPNLIEKRN